MGDNGQPNPAKIINNRTQNSDYSPGQRSRPRSNRFPPSQNPMVNLPFTDSTLRHCPMTSAAICTVRASKSQISGCLNPQLREQKPQKCVLIRPMREEPKIPLSGPFTAKSVNGKIKPVVIDPRKESHHPKSLLSSPPMVLFCLSLIFAATTITFATHNLHGFKKSSAYHQSCIQRHEGVWLGQETWLTEKQFPLMSSLGTQFVARSSMEDAISSGVFRGRPFSGVSIAWSPNLNGSVSPLTNFRHKRVVGVELNSNNNKTLIINVYMPFYDASKREKSIAIERTM